MGTSLACTVGEKGTPKPAGIAHLTHQPNFHYHCYIVEGLRLVLILMD